MKVEKIVSFLEVRTYFMNKEKGSHVTTGHASMEVADGV